VQPCVALGLGLKKAGHEVTVASWAPFQDLVEGRGLEFHPVAGPHPDRLMEALLEAGRNPLRYARKFRPLLRPHAEKGFRDCLAACRGADAVIYTPLGFAGYMAAELLGIFALGSVVEPLLIRSGSYPSAILGRPVGGAALVEAPVVGALYNHLSHLAVEQIYWRTVQPLVGGLRKRAGLPPMSSLFGPLGSMRRERQPMLLGWSEHVLPRSTRQEAWMPTTGYWFLDHPRDWQPPEELKLFLDAGEPPVSLGLGSMSGIESARTESIFALTAQALKRAGRRGVLLSNQNRIDAAEMPDGVIGVGGEVPYDWLFPRVAVAVHHGGAGTVAAALRAGVPSVVIPVLPDQAFWAWRVAALGAGPAPIPPKRLSPERLSAAIRQAATDPEMRRNCRLLSDKITAEDGIGKAVEAFELHVKEGR
ncbi:MAG: glycosyltransferase, partial [Actinomycetota bacterium]|nr:glycosyltransferase [Actinomycetota bacterium]